MKLFFKRLAVFFAIPLIFSVVSCGSHVHEYKEIAVEAAIASDAGCLTAAKYYYSCDCGDLDTSRTFSYGEPLDHDYYAEVTVKDGKPELQVSCKRENCTTAKSILLKNYKVKTQKAITEKPTETADGKIKYSITAIAQKGENVYKEIELPYKLEIYDINTKGVNDYLNAQESSEQFYALKNASNGDKQEHTFSWAGTGAKAPFIVKVYDLTIDADMEFPYEKEVTGITFSNYNIYTPGHIYYYSVTEKSSGEEIVSEMFGIKNNTVRFINLPTVGNFRDVGGWQAKGGRINYGLIYRGRHADNISATDRATFNRLGIKTEIDLRNNNNYPVPNAPDLDGVKYCLYQTAAQYAYVISCLRSGSSGIVTPPVHSGITGNDINNLRDAYKEIFSLLSDRNNYPFYIHCTAGADRTGTFFFLLNGLLGVSFEDLTRDFELTSFAGSPRWRSKANADGTDFDDSGIYMTSDQGNNVSWGLLKAEIEKYNRGGDLADTIENFLVNYAEIPQAQIDAVKSIMIG